MCRVPIQYLKVDSLLGRAVGTVEQTYSITTEDKQMYQGQVTRTYGSRAHVTDATRTEVKRTDATRSLVRTCDQNICEQNTSD